MIGTVVWLIFGHHFGAEINSIFPTDRSVWNTTTYFQPKTTKPKNHQTPRHTITYNDKNIPRNQKRGTQEIENSYSHFTHQLLARERNCFVRIGQKERMGHQVRILDVVQVLVQHQLQCIANKVVWVWWKFNRGIVLVQTRYPTITKRFLVFPRAGVRGTLHTVVHWTWETLREISAFQNHREWTRVTLNWLVRDQQKQVVTNSHTRKLHQLKDLCSSRMPDPDSAPYMVVTVPKWMITHSWRWSKTYSAPS